MGQSFHICFTATRHRAAADYVISFNEIHSWNSTENVPHGNDEKRLKRKKGSSVETLLLYNDQKESRELSANNLHLKDFVT